MKRLIILLLTLGGNLSIYAQRGDSTTLTPDGKWVDDALQVCLKNQGNTTNGSLQCLSDAIDSWQELVSTNYTTVLSKLAEPHRVNLVVGQNAWLNYKNQQFKFIEAYYSSLQGTEYKQMKLVSEIEILKRRAKELNNINEEE